MSYYNAIELMKEAIISSGHGFHYEDDPNIGDLVDSTATDFDGTFLLPNDGGGLPFPELYLHNPQVSISKITLQIATEVSVSRTKTDVVLETRMQSAIQAMLELGAIGNAVSQYDVKQVTVASTVEKRSVAGTNKIVGEVDIELVYRSAPTPIVLFTSENSANLDTTTENDANTWFQKTMTLINGGIVTNVLPLNGLNSVDFDGVNDLGEIPADHGDQLDFKIAQAFSFHTRYRHNSGTGNKRLLSRNEANSPKFCLLWSGTTKLRLKIKTSDGKIYNQYWEVSGELGQDPISLFDGSDHKIGFSYDGSKSMDGFQLYAKGLPMELITFSYANNDPKLTAEFTAGTELEPDIRWLLAGRVSGNHLDCTLDDICFFPELLSASHFAQLEADTSPLELV